MMQRMTQSAVARLMPVAAIVLAIGVAGTAVLFAAKATTSPAPLGARLSLNSGQFTLGPVEYELSDVTSEASPNPSLRVKILLGSAADFTQGHMFDRGNEFNSAVLTVFDQAGLDIATYTLGCTSFCIIQAVRYTTNMATSPPQFFQEIVLTSTGSILMTP